MILDHYNEFVSKCPTGWVYYEDLDKNIKGCLQGPYNKSLTGPKDFGQPVCRLFDTPEETQNNPLSCAVIKLFNEVDMSQYVNPKHRELSPSKKIVSFSENLPILIEIIMFDDNGYPHYTFLKQTVINFINSTGGNIDVNTSRQVAEVAKNLYLTHQLQFEQTTA
jgi:hypothetical protein